MRSTHSHFSSHFPNNPLIKNPISGEIRSIVIRSFDISDTLLSLHRVDFIDVNRFAVSENAHDNSKPNGDFGGSDSHNEKHEICPEASPFSTDCDKAEICALSISSMHIKIMIAFLRMSHTNHADGKSNALK